MAHLAALEASRQELVAVIARVDSKQLTADDLHSHYQAVIQQLKVWTSLTIDV